MQASVLAMFPNSTTWTNASAMPSQGNEWEMGFITSLVVLSIIFVTGMIGNSLVVAVVCCIPTMKTTTNYLLLNVAVADIITLLLTAIHVALARLAIDNEQISKNILFCKFIRGNTLCNVAILATCLTLTVLSVERYNALLQPMKPSRRLTKQNVAYVITGIWLVSMVMTLPMFVYLEIDKFSGRCSSGANVHELNTSLTFILIFMTIVPFVVIAFSYFHIISGLYIKHTICNANSSSSQGRNELSAKKKLVKLLLIITLLFFVTFVPYGVTLILKMNLKVEELRYIRTLARVMSFFIPFHSALNPVLYSFQSQNYREGFWVVVRKVFCKKDVEFHGNALYAGGTMV